MQQLDPFIKNTLTSNVKYKFFPSAFTHASLFLLLLLLLLLMQREGAGGASTITFVSEADGRGRAMDRVEVQSENRMW